MSPEDWIAGSDMTQWPFFVMFVHERGVDPTGLLSVWEWPDSNPLMEDLAGSGRRVGPERWPGDRVQARAKPFNNVKGSVIPSKWAIIGRWQSN
ncbi:MAG: hypothetical protein ACREP4_02960 [Stenotrophomonas sp.]|uniref:hypothetical protein n=1 Tax=Stenotrophomonas sp. TaxID=69392 RepID=UPI003D6C95C1